MARRSNFVKRTTARLQGPANEILIVVRCVKAQTSSEPCFRTRPIRKLLRPAIYAQKVSDDQGDTKRRNEAPLLQPGVERNRCEQYFAAC